MISIAVVGRTGTWSMSWSKDGRLIMATPAPATNRHGREGRDATDRHWWCTRHRKTWHASAMPQIVIHMSDTPRSCFLRVTIELSFLNVVILCRHGPACPAPPPRCRRVHTQVSHLMNLGPNPNLGPAAARSDHDRPARCGARYSAAGERIRHVVDAMPPDFSRSAIRRLRLR